MFKHASEGRGVGFIPGKGRFRILLRLMVLGIAWAVQPWVLGAETFFPIGVWLQSPTNATRYQAAGMNTYVGLWQGPTAQQLSELQSSGMRIICFQNEIALRHSNATNIIAWMHADEPDNARAWGARFGFGSPTPPTQILTGYQHMKIADATRPVFLNLGQGVAWDNWYGRGSRNRHPEDYVLYLEGCDIASFNFYPANHLDLEVAGNLWYVPQGVSRLRRLTADKKPVWNFIECTAIHHPSQKPKPTEVQAQVWMALIHGSRGIVYFAHQFAPKFVEAALLNDPEMLTAVTRLNQQITSLTPVLNSPTVTNLVSMQSSNPAMPIVSMVKLHDGFTYIFAVAMRPLETEATFTLGAGSPLETVEVLDESRALRPTEGKFSDHFGPWAVHLYRVKARSTR